MKNINANEFGFLPENSGVLNRKALQEAVDETGTIEIQEPGEYKIAGSVYVGSYTTLKFANGVYLKKVDEVGKFTHVLLNKGALTKKYDEHIRIENLHVIVNNIDVRNFEVFGLIGQISFHYVKDLVIEGYRCLDLGKLEFAIHICTFLDLTIRDIIVKGDKDGIHLGKGKRFNISNCVFETYDDAIALNAQDWDIANPELGWIEEGIIENCHDLDDNKENKVGFFCRMLAGGWRDWYKGMKVQKSDTVVSEGRLYRVRANPDGNRHTSLTPPVHTSGEKEMDGIKWVMTQDTVEYTAGVKNIIFRNIFLHKARTGFIFHLCDNKYNRSYYPDSEVPMQEKVFLDNIRVLHNNKTPLVEIGTPLDYVAITNSYFANSNIQFYDNTVVDDYLVTNLHITSCVFDSKDIDESIQNKVEKKIVNLHEFSNVFLDVLSNNKIDS